MNINQVQSLVYGLSWLNRCSSTKKGINQSSLVFKTDGKFVKANWIPNFSDINNVFLNTKLSTIFNPTHSPEPLDDYFEDEIELFKKLIDFATNLDFNYEDSDLPFKPNDVTDIQFFGINSLTLSKYLFKDSIELVGMI